MLWEPEAQVWSNRNAQGTAPPENSVPDDSMFFGAACARRAAFRSRICEGRQLSADGKVCGI